MDNFLLKTVQILEECKQHLEDTNNFASSIEKYLTQYVAVIFCADMEEALKQIFVNRIEEGLTCLTDAQLKEFAFNQLKRLKSNSLDKGDIANHIKTFSPKAKDLFNEQLEEKNREISFYSNVVKHRHSIAHTSSQNQITFRELEEAVEAAKIILNAMQIALQQEPHE